MDKSAAHVLNSLVPGLNEPFPAELVELARALLVESRGKASSLKADEEIARSYACSNLACERCVAFVADNRLNNCANYLQGLRNPSHCQKSSHALHVRPEFIRSSTDSLMQRF